MNNENPYDSLIWLRRRLKIAIAIRRVCVYVNTRCERVTIIPESEYRIKYNNHFTSIRLLLCTLAEICYSKPKTNIIMDFTCYPFVTTVTAYCVRVCRIQRNTVYNVHEICEDVARFLRALNGLQTRKAQASGHMAIAL